MGGQPLLGSSLMKSDNRQLGGPLKPCSWTVPLSLAGVQPALLSDNCELFTEGCCSQVALALREAAKAEYQDHIPGYCVGAMHEPAADTNF